MSWGSGAAGRVSLITLSTLCFHTQGTHPTFPSSLSSLSAEVHAVLESLSHPTRLADRACTPLSTNIKILL